METYIYITLLLIYSKTGLVFIYDNEDNIIRLNLEFQFKWIANKSEAAPAKLPRLVDLRNSTTTTKTNGQFKESLLDDLKELSTIPVLEENENLFGVNKELETIMSKMGNQFVVFKVMEEDCDEILGKLANHNNNNWHGGDEDDGKPEATAHKIVYSCWKHGLFGLILNNKDLILLKTDCKSPFHIDLEMTQLSSVGTPVDVLQLSRQLFKTGGWCQSDQFGIKSKYLRPHTGLFKRYENCRYNPFDGPLGLFVKLNLILITMVLFLMTLWRFKSFCTVRCYIKT